MARWGRAVACALHRRPSPHPRSPNQAFTAEDLMDFVSPARQADELGTPGIVTPERTGLTAAETPVDSMPTSTPGSWSPPSLGWRSRSSVLKKGKEREDPGQSPLSTLGPITSKDVMKSPPSPRDELVRLSTTQARTGSPLTDREGESATEGETEADGGVIVLDSEEDSLPPAPFRGSGCLESTLGGSECSAERESSPARPPLLSETEPFEPEVEFPTPSPPAMLAYHADLDDGEKLEPALPTPTQETSVRSGSQGAMCSTWSSERPQSGMHP